MISSFNKGNVIQNKFMPVSTGSGILLCECTFKTIALLLATSQTYLPVDFKGLGCCCFFGNLIVIHICNYEVEGYGYLLDLVISYLYSYSNYCGFTDSTFP